MRLGSNLTSRPTCNLAQHRLACSSHQIRRPLRPLAAAADGNGSSAPVDRFNWQFDPSQPTKQDPKVQDIPVSDIRRPLARTRANDQAKVEALMKSIQEIGLQEPIDVLLVEGEYYGFGGCHRFEAHQRLGLPTIRCRVRKANRQVLKMHMM